jgi:hypothetical protein
LSEPSESDNDANTGNGVDTSEDEEDELMMGAEVRFIFWVFAFYADAIFLLLLG